MDSYNAAGQLASITTPGNNLVEYGYTNNQIVSVKVNGTPVLTGAKYFPFGAVASWTWGNGQSYQRVFDTDGRIQSVTIAGQTRNYGFDNASRITSLTDIQGAATVQSATFGYDNLDRLTSALNTAAGGYNQTFVYDLIGNRNSETISGVGTTLTYGSANNRLATVGGQAIGFDPAGNTTSDGTFTYVYSGRNRLMQVLQGGSTLVSYKHNALGQRVSKSAGATTLFAYDEAGHLLGEYDSSGAVNQETVWLYDTPVATLRRSGGNTAVHYVWADHLDTPRAITTSDAASTLEWKWDSDPFGTTPAQAVALTYNLRFPGQYYDAETGKHYNYYRDYDPGTGRYIESDPLGLEAGTNTFAYGLSQPLRLSDSRGQFARGPHWRVTYDEMVNAGCSNEQAFKTAEASAGADYYPSFSVAQSVANAPTHGMAKPGQTVYGAYQNYSNFVSNSIASCITNDIGRAAHAAQDTAAAGHAFATYEGFGSLDLHHVIGDWFPSPAELEAAHRRTRDVIERAKALCPHFCGCRSQSAPESAPVY